MIAQVVGYEESDEAFQRVSGVRVGGFAGCDEEWQRKEGIEGGEG